MTTVVIYGGGGGMEPVAPIFDIDSGVVDGGNGGKEPTVSIIVVDDNDTTAMATIVDCSGGR